MYETSLKAAAIINKDKFVRTKTGVIRNTTKRTETSHWHPMHGPTSRPYFTLLCNCTKWTRDVGALHWMSAICFSAFCGIPNYTGFCLNNFFHYLFAFFLMHILQILVAEGCHHDVTSVAYQEIT